MWASRPQTADPAPASESELEFANELTRTRMTLDYQMTQGAQTVYYQDRWVGSRGQTGPWGELVSATAVKWACPLQRAARQAS